MRNREEFPYWWGIQRVAFGSGDTFLLIYGHSLYFDF